jgi:hypothetical protein
MVSGLDFKDAATARKHKNISIPLFYSEMLKKQIGNPLKNVKKKPGVGRRNSLPLPTLKLSEPARRRKAGWES